MKTKIFLTLLLSYALTSFAQTLREAIKQTTNEQFETADVSFKALLQTSPNSGEVYFYYGENFFKNENPEMAKAMYQKGSELNATNPLCHVGLGKILWYDKKDKEAMTEFYTAKSLSTTGKDANLVMQAKVLMEIADVYINAPIKNIQEAMTALNQALKLEPKNAKIYLLMGDAYLAQNNISSGTEANKQYEKAMELEPGSAAATLRIGKLYGRSNPNLALDYYKKAIEKDPVFAPAYREKAEILFKAGRYNDAVADYKKFLELNNNMSARVRYIGFLYQAKQYKEAITQGMEIFNKDSGNVVLYRYLGYSYFENAEYPNGSNKMESFFRKAEGKIKIIPLDYEYYGKLLAKTGKDSLGVIALLKAISLDSSKTDLYGELGSAYYKMKKYSEAIAAYKKKMAASGKSGANDYFSMGRAYYFAKDFMNADSCFAQVTRLSIDYPTGYLWRAKSNAQQEGSSTEKGMAKPHYEIFISKIKPEETEKNKKDLIDANTYLGVYYAKNKDYKTAKTYFAKVVELDPANENAKKFMDSKEAKEVK